MALFQAHDLNKITEPPADFAIKTKSTVKPCDNDQICFTNFSRRADFQLGSQPICAMKMSPDGSLLACSGMDGEIQIVDPTATDTLYSLCNDPKGKLAGATMFPTTDLAWRPTQSDN